ncbi:MAG: hypothetical protein GY913_18590 [Proteobacteria bacterium]|nr:hypothetical protein [Pseudomonadota bacterium]MCP4918919.1 hypothetical protein [Pseudomonadota bacterium]
MLLWTLTACLDDLLPAEFKDLDEVPVEVVDLPPAQTPRYEQGDLAGTEDGVALSGTLRCREPGRIHVRVYPNHVDDTNRRFDASPRAGFLSEVVYDDAGPFEIFAPVGPERLVLAFRDANDDGRANIDESPFFVDPHGRYMNLDASLSNLVLDCSVFPTRAPDNSKVSTIGTRGEEAERAARLKAEGRESELWMELPDRQTGDIHELLDEAEEMGIQIDGRPPKGGGFSDGSM